MSESGSISRRSGSKRRAVLCDHCGKSLSKPLSLIKLRNFCGVEHYRLWMKIHLRRANNPNFGRQWSDEQKDRQREIVKAKVDKDYRFKAGVANRGKIFGKTRRKNISRGHLGISHAHTEMAKKIIGQKSKLKWTPDFKQRFRQTMEGRGLWIPISKKQDWEIYFKESNWKKRMFDRCSNSELELLKQHGVFNAIKNTKGVVRDHSFSRRTAFRQGVFPEIVRHPCNCKIILHSDNVAKKMDRYMDRDDISLDTLMKLIQEYSNEWFEQTVCLERIQDFKSGKRWSRDQEREVHDVK